MTSLRILGGTFILFQLLIVFTWNYLKSIFMIYRTLYGINFSRTNFIKSLTFYLTLFKRILYNYHKSTIPGNINILHLKRLVLKLLKGILDRVVMSNL